MAELRCTRLNAGSTQSADKAATSEAAFNQRAAACETPPVVGGWPNVPLRGPGEKRNSRQSERPAAPEPDKGGQGRRTQEPRQAAPVPVNPVLTASSRPGTDGPGTGQDTNFAEFLKSKPDYNAVLQALRGENPQLKNLSPDQQRSLLPQVFDQWDKDGARSNVQRFASAAYADPELRGLIATGMAKHANSLIQQSAIPRDKPDTHPILGTAEIVAGLAVPGTLNPLVDDGKAKLDAYFKSWGERTNEDICRDGETYARAAIEAASGSLHRPAGGGDHYADLRQTLANLGPDGAAQFTRIFQPDAAGSNTLAQARLVLAMNRRPNQPPPGESERAVERAVIQNVFASLSRQPYPPLTRELSTAIARQWHPDSPGDQKTEAKRLDAGIIGYLAQLPPDERIKILGAVQHDPSITGASLWQAGDEPYRNPALTRSLAATMTFGQAEPGKFASQQDIDRAAGILGTKEGWNLLMGTGQSDTVQEASRQHALQVILENPSITAQTLTDKTGAESSGSWYGRQLKHVGVALMPPQLTGFGLLTQEGMPLHVENRHYTTAEVFPGDAWTNPAITRPIEQQAAQRYYSGRGDAPLTLQGKDVETTLGFSMHAQATLPAGMSQQAADEQMKQGTLQLFTSPQAQEMIAPVLKTVRDIAGGENEPVRMTVLPVTFSSPESGPVELPLYRVTGKDGKEWFVDNQGGRYDSFDKWLKNNALPPGTVTFPKDGHLTVKDGQIELGSAHTPNTRDTDGKWWKNAGDRAALVGGLAAGGVAIVASGGTLALVAGGVGAAAGLWGAGRGMEELAARSGRGLSINPLTDPEARGIWINTAANTSAVFAFGSVARLAQLGRSGRAVSGAESSVHATLQWTANTAMTGATAYEAKHLVENWDRMPAGERTIALMSMGFWTAGMGAGMRHGGYGPREMFSYIAMRNRMLESLPPPVREDRSLAAGTVEIGFRPREGSGMLGSGNVTEIRHGPGTSRDVITAHQAQAMEIQRSLTLEGRLANMVFRPGDPKPGTKGWAARWDTLKLEGRIAQRNRELQAGGLTEERRAELQQGNDWDRQTQRRLKEQVNSHEAAPPGSTIDASEPSTGYLRANAIRPGLANELQAQYGDGYYWRDRGEHVVPEIVVKQDGPGKKKLAVTGTGAEGDPFRITEVARDAAPADYNRVAEYRLGQGLSAQERQSYNDAIARRNSAVDQRDAILRERSVDELNQQEKEQYYRFNQDTVRASQETGELGAIGYVREKYGERTRLVFGSVADTPKPGEFDFIFQTPEGKFIVVEAKGGSSPLGTRTTAAGTRETQGTRNYFDDVLAAMERKATAENNEELLIELAALRRARRRGNIDYLMTRSSVGSDASLNNVNGYKFNIDWMQ